MLRVMVVMGVLPCHETRVSSNTLPNTTASYGEMCSDITRLLVLFIELPRFFYRWPKKYPQTVC